jgi:hypothetical protein
LPPFLNQKITNFNILSGYYAAFLQLLNIFGRTKYKSMHPLADKITTLHSPFADTEAQKAALKEESDALKQQLEGQIDGFKTDATRIGKQALVIGGSIMAVYLLLNLLLPNNDETDQQGNPLAVGSSKNSTQFPWLAKSVSAYAVTWLLGLAREKLIDFLATQNHSNAVPNTNSTSET